MDEKEWRVEMEKLIDRHRQEENELRQKAPQPNIDAVIKKVAYSKIDDVLENKCLGLDALSHIADKLGIFVIQGG
jgi:hypothetical protein